MMQKKRRIEVENGSPDESTAVRDLIREGQPNEARALLDFSVAD